MNKMAEKVVAVMNDKELEALIDNHSDAFADEASDVSQTMEQRIEAQQALVDELNAAIAHPPEIPPRAMIPTDVDTPADESIRLAGEFDHVVEPWVILGII